MNWGEAFAYLTIALDVAAAIGYGAAGDWRRAIYWASAAVLTTCVTGGDR